MEIVDFNEKNESPKENEKLGVSFNTFPNCEDRLTKTNTFSKSNKQKIIKSIGNFIKIRN